jgi:general secretion pathway protein L
MSMSEASQAWSLFGFDVRQIGHYFREGWRDFLWGDESPVLAAVDEVVQTHLPSGETVFYQSGRPISVPADTNAVLAEAVVIPDQLALARPMRMPAAAEANLEAVLALEVQANSPFQPNDTCYGWTVVRRSDIELELRLVISSRSAIMAHIAAEFDCHDVAFYEVWAQDGPRMILLQGFGEAGRQQRNRKRMVRAGGTGAYCLLVILLIFGLAAGMKYLELERVRDMQSEVVVGAKTAVEVRSRLVAARSAIVMAEQFRKEHPSPHQELKRLAFLLDDLTWLSSVVMKGDRIKIEGESADASVVMQQLLDHPAYARVEAPVAMRTGRSGMERFVLDLVLAGEEGAQ